MKKINTIVNINIIIACFFLISQNADGQNIIKIATPMTPPEWALLERQVIESTGSAIENFYNHYFDDQGYYLHVPRWGALDGTDDVPEMTKYWTLFHAMGGSDNVLELYKKEIEATYRQYSELKTTSTDVGRLGCFYKEFMPVSDLMHQAEGYQGLMFQGLSEPDNLVMQKRYRRFAGFYMNEDPDAMNYDPVHKIIRSFWTGSRGPMLREPTPYDWAGDLTIGKFNMLHHKDGKTIMMDYEKEYPGIIDHYSHHWSQSWAGDHPFNLCATQLALNAYMLDHDKKYRDWLIDYSGSWKERAAQNGDNFPSNVGPDGKTGNGVEGKWYYDRKSEKGKWYMGTYGWNFTAYSWSNSWFNGNEVFLGIWPGMANAYMLTGDPSYITALRKQMDNIYVNKKIIGGVEMIPKNYGIHIDRDHPRKIDVFDRVKEKLYVPDGKGIEGWYNWTPDMFEQYLIDIYLLSMDRKDLERIQKNDWISFLEGNNPDFPAESFKYQLEFIRKKMEEIRNDHTTPDTRLADWALEFEPSGFWPPSESNINKMLRLIMGGNISGRVWSLHTRVRYFDADKHRAGLPDDVAALVTKMEGEMTWITLVNINPVESRSLYVQTGSYGEHQCMAVKSGDKDYPVNNRYFKVILEPGTGTELVISAKRYTNQPTIAFPW